MKNKSKRHKSSNTFKFLTFSERISEIDVDVFHKVKHPYEEEDEESGTFYSRRLHCIINDNFSPDVIELSKKLPRDIYSLSQLLAQKDELMEILLNHIKSCDLESLPSALALIVAIAQDLRKEFYPFFHPSVLRECVMLLDNREPEQIECVFNCLAHLFKYLWAPIVKNIHVVLPDLLPLLSASKPKYINDFAAESFAFVARKVKDKSNFIKLSLKNVKKNQDELSGVAKLFFEVMKSVSQQFHSCAEEFLTLLLEELDNRKWSELLLIICETLVLYITKFVSVKTNISPLWNSFMNVGKKFSTMWLENRNEHAATTLFMVLKVAERLVTCREIILRNPEDFMTFLLRLGVDRAIKDFKQLHEIIIDIVVHILVNQNLSCKVQNSETAIAQIMENIDDEELLVKCCEKLIQCPQFELLVFNEFVKVFNSKQLNTFFVQFLAKIVWMKTKFCVDENYRLKFYSACLRSVPRTFPQFLLNCIPNEKEKITSESMEEVLYAIIILSFMENSRTLFAKRVDEFIMQLCQIIDVADSEEYIAKTLYSLLTAFQYRLTSDIPFQFDLHRIGSVAMKYVYFSNYLCSLRLLGLVSSRCDLKSMNLEKMGLIENLNSPFHKVRLFTLQALVRMGIHELFDLLLSIELITPSVETYREKLHLLQKLEYNEQFALRFKEEFVEISVMKFLCGNLYVNFRFMWEPTQKLIASHLRDCRSNWSTIEHQLNEAVVNDMNSTKLLENFVVNFKGDFMREHFYHLNGVDDRPDFYNFRCLLLETFNGVKNLEFTSKRFIADLFLNFFKFEYKTGIFEYRSIVNIKKLNEDLTRDDEALNNPQEFLTEEKNKEEKNLNRLLIIFLKSFNNFPHLIPQNMRSEVLDIYFDLLTNGNSEIQQLAVIYICKSRVLSVYREQLQLLTQESTLKDQLLNFKLDIHSNIFPDKDRPALMKIVLKILYGKVKKKCSPQLRESVFEFLAGCEDTDMISFFDLFFNCRLFSGAIENSVSPSSVFSVEVDLENTISPSYLSTYTGTVLDLLKRCGKLLKPRCLTYLLRILFKIMANWRILSNVRSEIHQGYYNLMNKIRITAFDAIIYFVDNFNYKWTNDEVEVLLMLFIDPWIEKIPEECLQSPNQVMRLIIIFANNTRYFPMLARECNAISLIDAIVRLLNSEKAYFNVKNTILEIIERLMTLEGDIKERSQLSSNVVNISDVSDLFHLLDEDIISSYKREKHLGKVLLQPYIPQILDYLQKQLFKKYIKLDGIYMLIFRNISEFSLSEESAIKLLDLLMPTLRNKATADDDIVLPLLQVITDLFKTFINYDNFEKYLLPIGQLFNIVASPAVRRSLCDLVAYISLKTERKFVDGDIIQGLNLNDKKWLEQPDFVGRLETFKKIKSMSENGELNLFDGVFIMYICFHTVKTEKDMGLRDHAGLCLKRMCPVLCSKYACQAHELNIILNIVLLPLIKEGIQSKNENYQLESVLLLGHMVRECNQMHFVFRNLFPLCDPLNLENDFFENIFHLQNFRRIKALKRFNEVMSLELRPPQVYSLMILHHLISPYLMSVKFATDHAMVTNAIEALKTICLLCPWRHYEKLLKLYIVEMRKNFSMRKQAIKIVSTVLDAFHFDISQADEDVLKNVKKLNEKKESKESDGDEKDELMDVPEEETDNVEKQPVPAVQRINVLCRSDAVRVFRSIKMFLIPSLDNAFKTYEETENYHKLSKKNANDDKEEMAVSSIPVSFAAVKLLKRLPRSLLDDYISTIFLKLSTYLKSRLPSIRLIARETMQNIILEVGPSYLPQLLSEMTAILAKGFQVHVLVFTAHAVLEKLESTFEKGVIDPCIDIILEICIVDLFGKVAEEKEVEKLSNKIPETKGSRSYNMLRILAEYTSQHRILDLVLPFKEILAKYMSSKMVHKVTRCLHYITTGLTHNKFISAETLLIFSYGVSHDCIPQLVAERENENVRIESGVPLQKPDTFLIPEEPRHLIAEKRKICIRTNAHVIIAFGLEILSVLLKRDAIVSSAYLPHLDPFVPLINDCLQSQHTELTVLALKCLSRLLIRDLPSVHANVLNICDSVFELLGKYSLSGTTTKNEELVMASTKVAQVLLQPKLRVKMNSSQLKILLFVVEDLLKNRTHYATGFSILGTIISHKFEIVEFHQLMQMTANLSIQSHYEDIRFKAQEALCRYMMYYAPNKKYRHYVKFYSSQIEYAEQFGRKSALEMLKKLIDGIRVVERKVSNSGKREMFENRLNVIKNAFLDLCPQVFVQLSFRLIVDDSPECKKMAADLISEIFSVTENSKEGNDLFEITLTWLKEKKIRDRRLAVQLFGLYASTLKEKFVVKLDSVLPVMNDQLHSQSIDGPGKYVKAPIVETLDREAEKDHLIFQVLQFYGTLFSVFPKFLVDEGYAEYIWKIGENCQVLLRHPHEWVRLEAARVLVTIFKSLNPHDISSSINKKLSFEPRYLRDENVTFVVRSLCLDFCDQFAPGTDVREELLKATAVNLIFFAEVLQDVKYKVGMEKLSLRWLMKKITKQCALEVVRSPFKYSVRTIVFNFFAALTKKIRSEKLTTVLPVIFLPLLRELSTTDEQGVGIRRIAKEVLSYFRYLEQYDQIVMEVQRVLDIKRAKRKSQAAHMTVTDPERAARRKLKVQLKKKEQRKRRLEKIRKRHFKSGKKKSIIISDE